MQSEDLDKKIRDAAEHHHPAYNEEAWSKMRHLLDEHLPQEKKDRRRILFFLLFFLLLGGGAYLWVSKPWKEKEFISNSGPATGQETGKKGSSLPSTIQTPSEPGVNVTSGQQNEPTSANSGTGNKVQDNSSGSLNPATGIQDQPGFSVTVTRGKTGRKTPAPQQEQPTDLTVGNKEGAGKKGILPNKAESQEIIGNNKVQKQQPAETAPIQALPPANNADAAKKDEPARTDAIQPENAKSDKKVPAAKEDKPKKTRESGFVFSLSAGPDISAAGLDDIGKMRPVYGVGIGYSFNRRFTLRTGFYTASKIYTASPADYKPDYTPPNINYLQKIDADCRVYEIPVTIAYNWGRSKNHQWFASAGLSSYIMKKETYDYFFKYPSGQTYTYNRIIDNENKHLFSAISLSGGYTRKLNNTFSFSAEPYIKVPLGGVGGGNIRLQSGGVLFTISAKLPAGKK